MKIIPLYPQRPPTGQEVQSARIIPIRTAGAERPRPMR